MYVCMYMYIDTPYPHTRLLLTPPNRPGTQIFTHSPTCPHQTHTRTHTTQVWASQPRVWEGMVLLPKYVGARDVTDKMSEALLLLPAPQLQVCFCACMCILYCGCVMCIEFGEGWQVRVDYSGLCLKKMVYAVCSSHVFGTRNCCLLVRDFPSTAHRHAGDRSTHHPRSPPQHPTQKQQQQDLIKKNPDVRAVLVTHVTRAKKQASLDAAKRKALGL